MIHTETQGVKNDTLESTKELFTNFRARLKETVGKCQVVIDALGDGCLIDTQLFNDVLEVVEVHKKMQIELSGKINELLPACEERKLNVLERLLTDKQKDLVVIEDAKKTLGLFLQVNTDNDSVRALFDECKKKASLILDETDSERIIEDSAPFRLFLDILSEPNLDISHVQEERIETEFPKPIPRLLYSGQFSLKEKNNVADEAITATPEEPSKLETLASLANSDDAGEPSEGLEESGTRETSRHSLLSAERHDENKQAASILTQSSQVSIIPVGDSSSSKEIAEFILESGCDSDNAEIDEENYIRMLVSALIRESVIEDTGRFPGEFARAAVLLKTMAQKNPQYQSAYKRFLFGTDAPLDDRIRIYSATAMDEVFDDVNKRDPLYLAALLRAMFMPETAFEYSLFDTGISSIRMLEDYIDKYSTTLREIYHVFSVQKRGFSQKELVSFGDKNTLDDRRLNIIARAKGMRGTITLLKKLQNKMPRFPGADNIISICFGPNSDLDEALALVADGKTRDLSVVKLVLEELANNDKIDAFINEKWREVARSERSAASALKSKAREIVFEEIKTRRDLIAEWQDFAEGDSANTSPQVKSIRDRLQELIPKALTQLKSANMAPVVYTLRRVLHALTAGELVNDQFAFSDFLKSHWVELGPDGKPILDPISCDINGFELWRRSLEHIRSERLDLPKVLCRTSDKAYREYFDNIGNAIWICRVLKRYAPNQDVSEVVIDESVWKNNVSKAQKSIEIEEQKFKADIELAYAYVRIEEHTKERILRMFDHFSKNFRENSNFGLYRLFLDFLRLEMDKEKDAVESKLRNRLKGFEESITKEKGEEYCPLAMLAAEKLNSGNFVVAEDFLKKLESGETKLAEDEQAFSEEKNVFADFLGVFEELSRQCRSNKGSRLNNWGKNTLEKMNLIDASWSKRYHESLGNILNNWPKGKGDSHPNKEGSLKNLFAELGFNVVEIKKRDPVNGYDNSEVFNIKVKGAPKNLPDYPHPIDAFGTSAGQKTFCVICLYGDHTAQDLKEEIINLSAGQNSIVLLDSLFELVKRRSFTEELKKTSEVGTFLLIDHALILYLATRDPSVRIPTLLSCALPLTYYQPFVNGSGPIPDEMFFGRKSELNDITAPTGANLVYGGRQLGKTALMRRARSIVNKPDLKEYAFFIDAKNKDVSATLISLSDELHLGKLLKEDENPSTWDELCQYMRKMFNGGRVNKLLLLIDEADSFLEDASNERYEIFTPLITLMGDTSNGFKFVFAGLHNVARTCMAISKNSPLGQLGNPLCIKPLSSNDARSLIQRPLQYLGYNITQENLELILINTNYYPGILHFFGYKLIQTISENYGKYYNSRNNPPFTLSDEQMGTILSSADMNESIKQKLNMTLELDVRYKIAANILAYLYYLEDERIWYGYTAEKIANAAKEYNLDDIVSLHTAGLDALLAEMAEMGILWSSVEKEDAERHYCFRRNNFLNMIGSEKSVLEFLADPRIEEAEANA
ncbi:MAG: hypothetical protein LBS75_07795 [Synergistaceae bacterium]|jgi:hypothetical protein|nr:hypothetical protein [Synergistaceae bacterium]